ncbi:hypothetical protein ACEPPN_012571 [Leptodophora sp. 'Broadleaf-Isolate-01']
MAIHSANPVNFATPRVTSDSGETQVHQKSATTIQQKAAAMASKIARQWEAILAVEFQLELEAGREINLRVILKTARIKFLSKFNKTFIPGLENTERHSTPEKVEMDADTTPELEGRPEPEHSSEHSPRNKSDNETRERMSKVDEVVALGDDTAAEPEPEPEYEHEPEPKIEEIPSMVEETPDASFNSVSEDKKEVDSSIPTIIKNGNATVDEEDDPTLPIEERIERMEKRIANSQRDAEALFAQIFENETRIQELEEMEEMEATLKRKSPDTLDEPEKVPAKKPQTSTYRRPSTRKEAKPKTPKVKAPKTTRRPRVASKIQKESFACNLEVQVQTEDPTNAPGYAYDIGTRLDQLVSSDDYSQFDFAPEAMGQNGYSSNATEYTQTPGSEFDHPTPADTYSQFDFGTEFETQNDYASTETGYTQNTGTQFFQSAPDSGYPQFPFGRPADLSPNPYSSGSHGYAQNLGNQFNQPSPAYGYSPYSSGVQSQPQSTYSSNFPSYSQNIESQPYQSYASTTTDSSPQYFDSQEEEESTGSTQFSEPEPHFQSPEEQLASNMQTPEQESRSYDTERTMREFYERNPSYRKVP